MADDFRNVKAGKGVSLGGARRKSCENPGIIARFQCASRRRDAVLAETMPILTIAPPGTDYQLFHITPLTGLGVLCYPVSTNITPLTGLHYSG